MKRRASQSCWASMLAPILRTVVRFSQTPNNRMTASTAAITQAPAVAIPIVTNSPSVQITHCVRTNALPDMLRTAGIVSLPVTSHQPHDKLPRA
jgi:hypothetical protein